MRTNRTLLIILLFAAIAACKKDDLYGDQFALYDLTYGECKPVSKADIEEYLLLKIEEEKYLKVEHINAIFNCSPGKILGTATLIDYTIVIDEFETQSLENCVCPYDLTYVIGPMEYESYILKLMRGGFEIYSGTVYFNASTDTRINLQIH